MKLPDNAVIAREKLTHYLLIHLPLDDKSAWPAKAGYTLVNPDVLMRDLREQILVHSAEFLLSNPYGNYFKIDAPLRGPNGRVLQVRSIWMNENLSGSTKFITLYPNKDEQA